MQQQFTIIKVFVIVGGLISNLACTGVAIASNHEHTPILEQVGHPDVQSSLFVLSKVQGTIGGYVQGFGEKLDNFFGDEAAQTIIKGSRLILYAPLVIYPQDKAVGSLNFRAQIDLPKTNNRWKILISSLEDDTNSTNVQQLDQNEVSSNQNSLAGRYFFGADAKKFSHVDLGLKFINYFELNPYIKLKTHFKKTLSDSLESRTTQNLYLERQRGLGWQAQQVFDYKLVKNWLARSDTEFTWWREDEQVLLHQRASVFEQVSPYRARAYFTEGYWNMDNQTSELQTVALGMNWREKLYQDWLYFEFEPRVSWNQEDQFNVAQYSVRFMMEMHFFQKK